MKNPTNGMIATGANPSVANCRTQLNQNFSNNQSEHSTIPITVQVKPNGAENDKSAAPPQVAPPPPPVTQIPQVDGLDDVLDDEQTPPTQHVQTPTQPAPSSRPKAVKQTMPLVLQLQAQSPSSSGMKKKDKDQLRIGISEARTPRNISPKPKESSPKQTIVATAKVTKPSSPGSSNCSPTSRPIRVSPSHSASIRGVNHSPIRAISPSRSSSSSSAVATSIASSSSGQPGQTYRLVNQEQLAKLVGGNRPNVTILVNGIKMPAQSQILPSPASANPAQSEASMSGQVTSATSSGEATKKAVLLRDQTLLLQDEIDQEIAERAKAEKGKEGKDEEGVEHIELNQTLPPPPKAAIEGTEPDMDNIENCKLKIYQKLKHFHETQQIQPTPSQKKVQSRKQNAQIRKKAETSKAVATQGGVVANSIAAGSGQNVISIAGRVPISQSQMRIKTGNQPGTQQIIIQSSTVDHKLQIIDTKQSTTSKKLQVQQQQQQAGQQQPSQQPPTKMEILRQIQSERKGKGQTLSFGGKTANMAQIRMIANTQGQGQGQGPNAGQGQTPRVLQVTTTAASSQIESSNQSPGIPLIVSSSGSVFSSQAKVSDANQPQGMMVNQPAKISIALKPNEDGAVTTGGASAGSKQSTNQKARKPRPKKQKKTKIDHGAATTTVTTPTSTPSTATSGEKHTERAASPQTAKSVATDHQRNLQPSNFSNFIQQKQILPVISEFQQQQSGHQMATVSQAQAGSINVTTSAIIEGDSENSVNQQGLIKKLLNAHKITLQPTHSVNTSTKNVAKKEGSVTSSGRPVTSVTEQELKSIGISLKHQDQLVGQQSLSPAKSDDSSAKSGSSTQPSTPTSTMPDSTSATLIPAPKTVQNTLPKEIVIKQEVNAEKNVENAKSEKEKNRKRKKSLDAKPVKKRRKGEDANTNPQQLLPLQLAEAPIRLALDACPPLGGGTLSQLGKECEEGGKGGWKGDWFFDGWPRNAASFYDVISEFARFEEEERFEPKTPDLIDLVKDIPESKHFYPIALSDDENSTDDESVEAQLASLMSSDKVGGFGDPSIIAPPSTVEFPVAPASPELEPKEEQLFTFLDRGGELQNAATGTGNTGNARCPSPELPLPAGFGLDQRSSVNDPVTVTLTFRNGQADKGNIEQALQAISSIIGYNIVDYKMEPDSRKKEPTRNALPDVVPKEDQRRVSLVSCKKCAQPILGEAAKKPIHPKNHPDMQYCTFSCMKVRIEL